GSVGPGASRTDRPSRTGEVTAAAATTRADRFASGAELVPAEDPRGCNSDGEELPCLPPCPGRPPVPRTRPGREPRSRKRVEQVLRHESGDGNRFPQALISPKDRQRSHAARVRREVKFR